MGLEAGPKEAAGAAHPAGERTDSCAQRNAARSRRGAKTISKASPQARGEGRKKKVRPQTCPHHRSSQDQARSGMSAQGAAAGAGAGAW
ncbi:hypothetical protein QFZ82_006919 [Streptomyces sp. V4I23]|nr:hypothetical protein [Streptomyces sp. V4I23]